MHSFLKLVVRLLRRIPGFSPKYLTIPYAWIPYHLYQDGSAWRPLFVTMELTYLCNLRCQMCSLVEGEMVTRSGQRKNSELIEADGSLRREMSTAEYLDVIRQIGAAGVRSMTLTGGEPTLRPDIRELVGAIKSHGIHLSMISNGSGKPEVYRELVRLGLDALTISIDGTREVHDRVRGKRGSFDKAVATIETVIDEKKARGSSKPTLGVSCAVSALNQDDVENLAQWFRSYDIDSMNFGYLHFSTADRQKATEEQVDGPVLHLKNHEIAQKIVQVDTSALAGSVARVKAERERDGFPVTFTPDLSTEEIHKQYTDEMFTYANKCFQPWLATRIDPWGQMYPCWIDIRLGDVREHGFLKLWNSQLYKRFRQTIREKKLLPKCTTCCALTDQTWSKIPTLKRGLLQLSAPCSKEAGS